MLLMSPKNQTYQSQSCLVLNYCKSLDQKMHLQITARLFKFFFHFLRHFKFLTSFYFYIMIIILDFKFLSTSANRFCIA